MQERVLAARGLEKAYKGRRVVSGVDLEVGSGQVVGLLGPNGAGKTTTFHLVVGLIQPDRGRILLDEHGGRVPRTREALEALPGVGRKTANVVMSCAFGEDAIAVDTHVFRVTNRLGLADASTRRGPVISAKRLSGRGT